MKKAFVILLLVLTAIISLHLQAYAQTSALLNIRRDIFEESRAIKAKLTSSKDVILLNSLWDACVISLTQLDAYFSMLGIFNTIKDKDLTSESIEYLSAWLNEIKKTNSLNITSLNSISSPIEQSTTVDMEKLKTYFAKLNGLIDNELNKLSVLKKSLKIK